MLCVTAKLKLHILLSELTDIIVYPDNLQCQINVHVLKCPVHLTMINSGYFWENHYLLAIVKVITC